jgi:N-acetylglucosamine-6-phosphate deacetylase
VLVVSAPRLLIDGALIGPGSVVVDGGRIVDVTDGAPPAGAEWIRLEEGILTAGMVDLQVNGFGGADFSEASPGQWAEAARRIALTGVTSFVATYVTDEPERLVAAVERARSAMERSYSGARLLGVHLEGPFLSPRRAGAHDAALMRDPDPALVEVLLAAGPDTLRIVTLAPERPGALEAIARFTSAGVTVSLGHSNASAAEARAGADAGARLVTHLFNAQPPLRHREPGLPGLALDDERLTLGLIADLVHVAPEVVRIVFRAAGNRIALVTDAVAATGMSPGRYFLGGTSIDVGDDGLPRLTQDEGVLAGSTLTLDQAVRNVVSLGVDPGVALGAATHVPGDVIHQDKLGQLASGAPAHLVWWSDDLRVLRVWVDGRG